MAVLILAMLFAPLAASAASIPESDQAVIRKAIQDNYVIDIDPEKLENLTVEKLETLLDENSAYIPPAFMKELMEGYNGEFEGVGMFIIEERGRIVVAEPMAGSPAQQAGIRTGDQIVTVNDVSLEGRTVEEAANLIKGPRGTQVTLGIQRVGHTEPLIFTITRQQIIVTSISTNILEDTIGYLQVRQFSEHTAENARLAVDDFRAKGIEKLIVDLRGNPGGLLMEGVEFARLFIPRGAIVHILYRDGMITYSSYLGEDPFDNIVLLVDEGTASAAEIFAAAFRDRDVGILVGEPTYGKGSVQRLYPLPSGAGFKLTEAVYVSPDYTTIDGVGVMPSINMLRFHPSHDPAKLLPLETSRRPAIGARGDDVAAAQQRLKNLGYAITDPAGTFGQSTHDAVKTFQADEKVFPYGVLDFSTQRRLQRTYINWLLAPEQDLQLTTAVYYLQGHRSSHENVQPIPHGSVQFE